MKITQEFTVARPVATVWDFFQNVPEVAQCLPGAELLSDDGAGNYTGKVSVKLGPLNATFDGTAKVTPDAAAKTGLIDGKGSDRRGGSRGSVKVVYALIEDGPSSTKVSVDADVVLSGSAAQFGRGGLITEMSNRLIGEFVACCEAKLAATTVEERAEIKAADVKPLALFFQSLVAWIKGLFGGKKTPAA
ncbi:SRPBCC family protein [Kineosporia sp. A_224]|uniref:SRPBCC family protein n=1 Tax=Kineosporia sp. A_224 TaxID=1962180 RepID=UPI000B4BF385|nr:SRPBCC family protein [Kineosporia sp. A_224]